MKFIKSHSSSLNPGYKKLSDEDLINRYQKTLNTELVGKLYIRYTHLVYGVCVKYLKNKQDAEDAVMDIFEKLLTSLLDYDIKNFHSWLYSVSRNHCLMIKRKEKIERQNVSLAGEAYNDEFMEMIAALHHNNDISAEEQVEKVQQALKQLKKEQKRCVELLYLKQRSYKEITAITGYSMKQVKSYIQNGKRNIKLILERENEHQIK